jgi:F-type H+-transporting ATPase subunit delta
VSISRTDAIAAARRYATAIFALAVEAKQETAVVEEISTLAAAIADNAELHAALANPLVNRSEKAAVLAALAKTAAPLTQRAVAGVAENGRAEILPVIAELLRADLATQRGELVAEITSAHALSADMQKQLSAALAKATGKAVQMQLKEDPAVLGGVAIQMGSLRLDATLAGALNTMRTQLVAHANQS